MLDAAVKLAGRLARGDVSESQLDEAALHDCLYDPSLPDPDLLIRTSGELRVSNFLLWQFAYTEIWVTDVLWPDFTAAHLSEGIRAFQARDRRYGIHS
jgi:undecaprenyl diphosphate synthase